jgi:hypothetical protein
MCRYFASPNWLNKNIVAPSLRVGPHPFLECKSLGLSLQSKEEDLTKHIVSQLSHPKLLDMSKERPFPEGVTCEDKHIC